MQSRAASLAVQAKGETRLYSVERVLGDPEIPMQRAAVEAKSLQFMQAAIGASAAREWVDFVLDADPETGMERFLPDSRRPP